jgi:hypothetical protein
MVLSSLGWERRNIPSSSCPRFKRHAASRMPSGRPETGLPDIYPQIHTGGRPHFSSRGGYGEHFRPDNIYSLSSVQLGVETDEMAKNIEELNYGYNNDLSYEMSHHGISPFAVIGVSMATVSRHQADCFTRTSNLTLPEVFIANTMPDPIPPLEYHEMVNL